MDIQFPKAEITDYEALEKITLKQITSYLSQKGWRLINTEGFASGWRSLSLDRGVLVPTTTEVVDYVNRIGDCIRALAAYEQRSQINIWIDITSAFRAQDTQTASLF